MEIIRENRMLPIREPAYQIRKWAEIRCAGGSGWETACEPGEHLLLIVKSGAGRLHVDRDRLALRRNGYGPKACGHAAVVAEGGSELHGFCLTIAALNDRGILREDGQAGLPDPGEWTPALYDRLLPVFEQLAACCGASPGLPHASLSRGRLLYRLLEELAAAESDRNGVRRDPVRETRAYMEANYAEDLPRERLAQLAGLSPWHYSFLFKQATGLSPIACLNEIRIRKARELLLSPHANLKEVAQATGYRDEFYFSRKFKQTVGVSPTVYVRKTPDRLANLCFPYDGNIMALQLTPCVSIVDEDASHRSEYFRRIAYPLTGQLLSERNMSQLRRAQPYLIVCGDDQDYNLERLGRIAPTLSLSWTGMGWRDHLLQLGGAIGREKEAERWLAVYEERAAEARMRVRRSIGKASCLAVALCEDKLIAYRSRNMGELLYRDLQISQPFEEGSPAFVKRRIDMEQLEAWDADILLLHVYSDPQAGSWLRRLERDARWQSLRAVRENRVFRIDGAIWREYSAYSQHYMLSGVNRLLAGI